jgi:E3 ubiquitin-protein ligase MARCH6
MHSVFFHTVWLVPAAVFSGLLGTVGRAVKFWLHYTLVAVAWLGVVRNMFCALNKINFEVL